jgi:hypothetical protein
MPAGSRGSAGRYGELEADSARNVTSKYVVNHAGETSDLRHRGTKRVSRVRSLKTVVILLSGNCSTIRYADIEHPFCM